MKRRALLAGTCAGVLALVVGCANSTELSAANGRTTIMLASSITGSSFLAVTAGIEQGIFDKNGIDVEVIKVKSTAEATAAVASGQATVAAMLTEGVISSRASGSDLKIIANLLTEQQSSLHDWFARRGIPDPWARYLGEAASERTPVRGRRGNRANEGDAESSSATRPGIATPRHRNPRIPGLTGEPNTA
ncbi:ABC transporter substrate-binding protein [Rhodococcus opacus]|uniref:SsuA/THI5-like domain-containing protein n=1 Tax=Rhodococcus opacus (strain B4) TaxID=632772 RepID=C1B6S0_RHOOB|nr:ABC transporter substrate-binding protein [Rhodococcus opacus]BAH51373.1 hypothetical protein ROP_31260 [Rhodococcus opacus B4]